MSDTPDIIQRDHVESKVHLEQGFATATDAVPSFYWDFTTAFWK